MKISDIKWPDDPAVAARLLSTYMLAVVSSNLAIASDLQLDISLLRDFIEGNIEAGNCVERREQLWEFIESNNGLSNFSRPDLLRARLSLSILAIEPKSLDELREHLSWFWQMLRALNGDVDHAIALANDHFQTIS